MSSIHGTKAVGHWGQRRTLWWVESENLGISFHFYCQAAATDLHLLDISHVLGTLLTSSTLNGRFFSFSIFLSWTQGTDKLKHIEYSTSSKMSDHKPDPLYIVPMSRQESWIDLQCIEPCNHEMVYDKIFPDFMYNSIWLFRDKLSFPCGQKGHLCGPKQHGKFLSNFLSIYFLE